MTSAIPVAQPALRNPYSSFLENVEKPARYIGGEKFIKVKNWNDVHSKVAMCFPDVYEIGMSHLGYKILYDELNNDPQIAAERCYAPWVDMEKEIRARSLSLVTLENFRPLKDFDIVGFSLQYEMTYTNVLNMLELGGITIWQNERREEEPFVICGGPCATHPEPLAPFMDFVVVGDGEDLFVKLAHAVPSLKKEGFSRKEILAILGKWKGVYVPSLYLTTIDPNTDLEVVSGPISDEFPKRVERFFVNDLKNYPIPTETPIPHLTAIFDRHSVELSRGCTEGCRFCQAGMIYRPVRERRPDQVIESVISGMKKGGFDEASLTCLSTADYSAITPLLIDLLDKMKEEKATLGISSLRAYGLDKRILDKMSEVKNSSLTFAPEAGTERMRKVINKNITERDMLRTAEEVFSRGWQKMKLYFMIGLPTETDEDVVGIMETGFKALKVAKSTGQKRANITISVSTHVPKPHTPFQWCAMESLPEIERKQNILADLADRYRLNFRKHLSKTSYFEGVVARGDRRVAKTIYRAWELGARFDGWNETFDYAVWMKAIEDSGIKMELYLGTIRMDGKLPWSHIDVGLEDKFLEREWIKATKDRLSPPCGKPAHTIVHHSNLEDLEKTHTEEKKPLVCYHCGVACDLKGMVDERRDFLTTLKAFKNEPYVQPERDGKDVLSFREKRGQEIGYKYRLQFSKLGPISFISHLDLQKVIARIFRRAGVEVLYSEGYNPKPLFSFGPALSLGISSLSEFFDVRTKKPIIDTINFLEELNQASEKGLHFISVQEIKKNDVSIQESVHSFEYFVPFANHEVDTDKFVDEVLKSEKIILKSWSKKDQRFNEKDIRPLIKEMRPYQLESRISNELIQTIDEVSPCTDGSGVLIRVGIEDGSSIRPREIVECFAQMGVESHRPIKLDVLLN